MQVLTLVPLYPPHHIGGYEVVCRGVMERLAEQGHQVVVLTAEHTMDGVPVGAEGPVQVVRALRGWWDWDTSGLRSTTPAERLGVELHNHRVLRQVLRRYRPQVASVWSLVYMSFSLVTALEERSLPVVLTLGDDWMCFASELDSWMQMMRRQPWLRPAARLLGLPTRLPSFGGARVSFASRMIADSVNTSAPWRFPDAPVIPMGFEPRDFPVVADGTHHGDWGWDLLYAGRVVPQKGVATLVRALSKLPEPARLDIDGYCSDGEHDRLSTLADELGVAGRVHYSRSPRGALAARYRRADAVVFPSEWPEPFGLVPLEAMASGTPVVATGTGGSGEFLVDGENCLLFPAGDAGALAEAVNNLASDPDLRRRVVTGGLRTARAMTLDAYAQRLESLHLEAVQGSTGG